MPKRVRKVTYDNRQGDWTGFRRMELNRLITFLPCAEISQQLMDMQDLVDMADILYTTEYQQRLKFLIKDTVDDLNAVLKKLTPRVEEMKSLANHDWEIKK